ncbi:ABC transporter substrate-binding protein [Azospirillum rugosum]|uniref:Branched-chain amino acid transport system substrate-binding protein n=1 Tax=Azospirillum rugosum TaxID=416170 RepID=A0ABS4SLU3_9PROT|nr:ABC transporter substrate-binding protein [Azospirillum rugosum]MBP2292912.1 branched-chain amino acid transport system substrate-binding protein [Azospirillum rugosum]MDQ0529336.1 branched-chain amino acid transport system substrate-binding protein [Azospirillum rugosum]
MSGAFAKIAGAALAIMAATGVSAASAQETIKIGSILSVTGPAAFLGEDMKAGMEIAVEEINAAGGINGRKVDWVFYDAESQTQKAMSATRRLLTQDRVDMIVGGGSMSGIALAMAPMAEQAKVPFISTEGAMNIVQPVSERKWTFKSTVDDDSVLDRIADYLAKKDIRKVALLADSSGFGQSATEQMKLLAPKRQLDVTYEAFNPADTDMTAQLTRIRDSGAQAIICWTVTPAGVVFLKQAQQLGLGDRTLVHSYGFVSQRYMDLAGDAAKNLLLVSVKFPVGDQLPDSDPLKPRVQELIQKFQKRYGRPPNQYVAQTYDAIQLARLAVEKGGKDKAKLRDALEAIAGYNGTGGTFTFTPARHSGLSKDDIVMLDWKNGRFNLADYR